MILTKITVVPSRFALGIFYRLVACACSVACAASLAQTQVTITSLTDNNKALGTIELQDTGYGTLITPSLSQLPPGLHGFHLHAGASCAQHGKAALGHFDPEHAGKHLGPYNPKGHKGDLPALYVSQQGQARQPMLAPRLKVSDFKGHALIIHAGSDNYADTPKPLGGGGARLACGVI